MLVGGFALFAAVVLGGIFYWSYSAAPERNVKLGDELVVTAKAAEAAGNADEAYKSTKMRSDDMAEPSVRNQTTWSMSRK